MIRFSDSLWFSNNSFFSSGENLFYGLILMNLMVLRLPVVPGQHIKTAGVFSVLSSTGMPPRENSSDDGGRSARPLHQIQGDFPQPAHPSGA